jgi:hypothetical protein
MEGNIKHLYLHVIIGIYIGKQGSGNKNMLGSNITFLGK